MRLFEVPIKKTDAEIDEAVYKLYGLDADDINVIDNNK
jgi:ribosomal protein L23